jgi:hypothetical protein
MLMIRQVQLFANCDAMDARDNTRKRCVSINAS